TSVFAPVSELDEAILLVLRVCLFLSPRCSPVRRPAYRKSLRRRTNREDHFLGAILFLSTEKDVRELLAMTATKVACCFLPLSWPGRGRLDGVVPHEQ